LEELVSLHDVGIIIPTFLRRAHLRRALASAKLNFSEAKLVVACDDDLGDEGRTGDHTRWVQLPFDSGLTAKRNAAVQFCADRKYVLVGCDDFLFDAEAYEGANKLQEVLEAHPNVDCAVGRVNNIRYEGFLELKTGEYIREHRLAMGHSQEPGGGWHVPFCLLPHVMWNIDLGINYFMARTQVLFDLPWDETIRPIGGEHADFFLTLKLAQKRVVWVPDVNITTINLPYELQDPRYSQMRCRAFRTGHKIFLDKWGVKKYIAFDEKP
jgi:hypothetical protein